MSSNSGTIALLLSPDKNNPDLQGNITLLNGSKNLETNIFSQDIAVSPDGKYIASLSTGGINIYNSSMSLVDNSTSNGTISDMAWGNGDTLYYSSGGSLWKYSIANNYSGQIAQTAGQSYIDNIYPDYSGSFVYFTVSNSPIINTSQSGNQLYRIGLNRTAQNFQFSSFSAIFPNVLQGLCSVNYVNFNSAILYVSYPSNISQQYCASSLQRYLSAFSIDTSGLDIVYQPLATG